MTFSDGSQAMARHCLDAIKLIERGQWDVNRMKQWLQACIENDPKFLSSAVSEINQKMNAQ